MNDLRTWWPWPPNWLDTNGLPAVSLTARAVRLRKGALAYKARSTAIAVGWHTKAAAQTTVNANPARNQAMRLTDTQRVTLASVCDGIYNHDTFSLALSLGRRELYVRRTLLSLKKKGLVASVMDLDILWFGTGLGYGLTVINQFATATNVKV